MPFVEASPPQGMQNMTAISVASGVSQENDIVSHVKCVHKKMRFGDLKHLMDSTTHGGFAVVEKESWKVEGFATRNRIVRILNEVSKVNRGSSLGLQEHDFATTLNSKRFKLKSVSASTASSLQDIEVDLSPYIESAPLTIPTNFPMTKVYTLFRALGLRHLVLVDKIGRPAGILTRKELMCAFDRDLM